MSEQERAPLGHPAEAEVPHHAPDPDMRTDDGALEDQPEYELAVEDGTVLSPEAWPGDAGDTADAPAANGAPEFREPGQP